MPELSRFYGIILKMLYSDNDQHTFMCITMAMKHPSALTANYLPVLCP